MQANSIAMMQVTAPEDVESMGTKGSKGPLERARQDERDRLASILEHGADTLARVLAAELGGVRERDDGLCRWLSRLLLDRLYLTQWVLGHWGGAPVLEIDERVGAAQFADQLRGNRRIFALGAAEPTLRSRLHWNNGALSLPVADGEILRLEGEWPAGTIVSTPAAGLFGYVLGEILTNAIKYGAPGRPVVLRVCARDEALELCVSNEVPELAVVPRRRAKTYGGLGIVAELARLSSWSLERRLRGDRFEVVWTCPAERRGFTC